MPQRLGMPRKGHCKQMPFSQYLSQCLSKHLVVVKTVINLDSDSNHVAK